MPCSLMSLTICDKNYHAVPLMRDTFILIVGNALILCQEADTNNLTFFLIDTIP